MDPLPFQFAVHALGDAQFCSAPHPIDFTAEVFGKLGCVDHQQGFVVVCAADGDQLKDPVITVFLSMTANL